MSGYARAGDSRFTGRPDLRVISLGAGVQSSVLALMAARGEIKDAEDKPIKIDFAIFADTGWEPKSVYEHLIWLKEEISKSRFPFIITKASVKDIYERRGSCQKSWKIQEHLLKGKNSTGQDFVTVPVFVLNGEKKRGLAKRQCTREYKLDPIRLRVRQLMGIGWRKPFPKNKWVEQWLGISYDEITRMKDSRDLWCKNRFPLIDQKLRRADCRQWFAQNYPNRFLPRSACIGCPLRTDKEWRDMKENDPESWEEAVKLDKALRNGSRSEKFSGEIYLHNSFKPLDEVNFACKISKTRHRAFLEECEGLCGV